MDEFDSIFGEEDPNVGPCNCGSGWCGWHGTFHYSDEEEQARRARRDLVLEMQRSTRGGSRVVRKRIREGCS